MTAERVFLDTNIVIYAISDELEKVVAAKEILRAPALERVISSQVAAEFVNVARKKSKLDWDEIRESAALVFSFCRVEPVTTETIEAAVDLCKAHSLAWYDALIVASAMSAGASRLLTEDMQAGRKFGGMTIVNPFA